MKHITLRYFVNNSIVICVHHVTQRPETIAYYYIIWSKKPLSGYLKAFGDLLKIIVTRIILTCSMLSLCSLLIFVLTQHTVLTNDLLRFFSSLRIYSSASTIFVRCNIISLHYLLSPVIFPKSHRVCSIITRSLVSCRIVLTVAIMFMGWFSIFNTSSSVP